MPKLYLSADELHLTHVDLEEAGIQEKYLRSHLCPNEALTELDVRRFIASTGMQAHIQVVDLADLDAIKTTLESLPTTLMLNIAGAGETPEWAFVVIKADTIEIHAHQGQEKIKQAIESALPPDTNSTFLNEPLNNTSDGYQILHALYAHEVNQEHVANLPDALNFSLMSDEQAIIQFIYRTELKGIVLSEAVCETLKPEVVQHFGADGHIKVLHLEALMNLMDEKNVKGASPSSLVIEQIGSLNIYSKDLFFPSVVPASSLSSTDYYHFLTLLHEKCKDEEVLHPVKNLTLSCVDTAAFEGLIAYSKTHQELPFETLTLDIMELDFKPPNQERSLLYLKSVLLTVSQTNLKSIELFYPLDEEALILLDGVVKELEDFITSRAVAVDVVLPVGYRTWGVLGFDAAQENMDNVTSERMREKNIRQFGVKKQAENADGLLARPVRKRPKLGGKSNLNVDIELEQEQQAEMYSEASVEAEKASDSFETAGIRFYHFNEFTWALMGVGGYLSIPGEGRQTDEDRAKHVEIWSSWLGTFGEYELYDSKATQLSEEACQFLLNHQEYFQYGLDLKRLPPGFILKQDDSGCYIHYDKALAPLSEYDPLRVQVRDIPELEVPTPAQFERWLEVLGETHPQVQAWHDVNKEPHNRTGKRAFKSTLPDKVGDDTQKRALLDALTRDTPELQDKINHLFRAVSDLSVGALLQLYLKYGEPGIDALQAEIDSDKQLFKQLNTAIYKKTNSYAPLFDEASKEAIKVIQGLTEGERIWFDKLVTQHGEAQRNVCLVDLVNAFKAFKKEVSMLETEGNQPLHFFHDCGFSGVKSMPVALSRMLTLLKHVEKKDRYEQWHEVSHIDLAVDGMMRAISQDDDGFHTWAFITRTMHMNMDHIKARKKQSDAQYRYTTGWAIWHSERDKLYLRDKPRARFYRYVACQEKSGRFPLSFYQYVDDVVYESGLSDSIKAELYEILAQSLSGYENLALMPDMDTVKKELAETIKMLSHRVASMILPSIIQDGFWAGLLSRMPGFPIHTLNHALSFISTRFSNPIFLASLGAAKIAQNEDAASVKFVRLVTSLDHEYNRYGASIYEGMKAYKRSEYEEKDETKNIFPSYIKTLNTITSIFDYEAEPDLNASNVPWNHGYSGWLRDLKKARDAFYENG
ncbi:MAG: hypothetical protein K0U37_05265, partial [Gammaproteobacteria bacterium]|nr:hypothetical protein [Gammaproteobacteria bacterium]